MAFVPEKGAEPIPGYQLIERLGVGGYGEVWKASAPGGLLKAIKIVYGKIGDAWAEQELRALTRIKEVRHPFLLSLERYEIIREQLIIVTEVADRSLMDRFQDCRSSGLLGIPREEMLGYVRDASDALDYMNESYGLQHQDIKPQNLLILSGRVKVADFGLVKDLAGSSASATGGVTPIYAPPEAFDGRVSRFSDQYSLAIVYQEMLTGVRPFPGSTALQLATQHTSSPPLLHPLPPSDRPVIARALAKAPDQRYPTCRAMADALLKARFSTGPRPPAPPTPAPIATPLPLSKGPIAEGMKSTPSLGGHTDPNALLPPKGLHQSPAVASPVTRPRGAVPLEGTPCPVDGPLVLPKGFRAKARPTLFVGVGGLAGRTLRHLRRQLIHDLDRTPAEMPEFLLLDTDRPSLLANLDGSYDEAFSADSILHLPLRRPEHHRAKAGELLRWLDRRWLYGIPRSQLTEGIRPLGRLALVDNAEELLARMRHILSRMHPTRKEAAEEPEKEQPIPRVFLVASITGGSGSGMLLDLGYGLRQLMRDMGIPSEDTCAVLLYGAGQKPTGRELARLNAEATLRELNHFHRLDVLYPGEPQAGLWPLGGAEPPFTETYLLHLGDGLTSSELEKSTQQVAEYLRINVVSNLAALLERFRAQTHASVAGGIPEVRLRTSGVLRMTFPRSTLAKLIGNLLSQHVVQRWRKHDTRGASRSPDEETTRKAATWGVEPEALARHFCSSVEAVWGVAPEAQFQKLLSESPLRKGPLPRQPELGQQVRQVMIAIDGLLGENTGTVTLSLCQTLMHSRARELCSNLGKSVVDWLVGLVEEPEHRVLQAERAAQTLAQDLIAKTERAQERLSQVMVRRESLRDRLLAADLADRTGSVRRLIASGLRQDAPQGPLEMLLEYCWVKLTAMAWERTLDVLGAVSRHLAEFRENLVLCQQKLRHLSEHFAVLQGKQLPKAMQEGTAPGVMELLPGQAANLTLAASALMDRLPREIIDDFERLFQAEVLGPRGGLMALATDNGTLFEHVQRALEARTVSVALEQVAQVDAAQLFLEQQGSAEKVKEGLTALLKNAAPRLDRSAAWQHLLIAVPDSLPGDLVRDVVVGLFPDSAITTAETDGDVIVCLEAANLRCQRTAAALVGDRIPAPEILERLMSRIDVDWTPLEPPVELTTLSPITQKTL